jgi:hypothetical protein
LHTKVPRNINTQFARPFLKLVAFKKSGHLDPISPDSAGVMSVSQTSVQLIGDPLVFCSLFPNPFSLFLNQLHAPEIVEVEDAFYGLVGVDDDQRGDFAFFEDGKGGGG